MPSRNNMEESPFSFGEGKAIIQNEKAQGRIHWTLFGLLWISFVTSYVSVNHCSFVKKGDASLDSKALEQMGIFKVPVYGDSNELLGCIRYDSGSEWDTSFKVVRTSSVFLLVCLSLLTMSHSLSVLFLMNDWAKLVIHWVGRSLVFPALLFNSILFIILGGAECKADDMQCQPGAGAILAIVNEFLIVFAALLYMLVPPPPHPTFIRYSALSELQQQQQRGKHPLLRGQSMASLPETVKAKNIMKKKASQTPKSSRNSIRNNNSKQADDGVMVLYDNIATPSSSRDPGSSFSTLASNESDVEAPASPPRSPRQSPESSPRRSSRVYKAPSRTTHV